MANRWRDSGNSDGLYFLGSQITVDGDCSHEIKRHLLLGRKVMTKLDSIFKSRDITLSTKVRLLKAMVFPVVMCGCESWTVKKAEHRGIDPFELWCWRRLFRVSWTARRSNQSILREIGPECSLEGLMLKLKLWPPDVKNQFICRDPDTGKDWRPRGEGDNRGWNGWMASLTQWTWVLVNSGSWCWPGRPGVLRFMGFRKSWTQLSNWTELSCSRF